MAIIGMLQSIAKQQSWVPFGRCREIGPLDEVFFPDRWGRGGVAKSICASCPVANRCLEYALENDEKWGVWGGKTPQEREKIRLGRYKKPFHTPTCGCAICVRRRSA